MNTITRGLAVLIMCGLPAFSQDKPKATSPDKPVVSVEQKQIATLKLDVAAQRRAALQERTDRLALEQELLRRDIAAHEQAVRALQGELNELFTCGYDLDKRACRPEAKAKTSP